MTELKKRTTETEEKPKWLITEDGVVKGINTLLLSKTILDNHPVIGVPFAGDIRYYQFDGISWKNAKEKSIRTNIEKLALKELEKYNAFNVKRIAQKSINWTIFIQLLRQHLRYDFDYKN